MSDVIARGQITLYDYTDATISLSTDSITVDSDNNNSIQITVQDRNGNIFRPEALFVDNKKIENLTAWTEGTSFEYSFQVDTKNGTLNGGVIEFKVSQGDSEDTALLYWTNPISALSQTITYAKTDKPANGYTNGYPTDATWSTTKPTLNAGDYFWIKTVYTLAGNTQKTCYSFSKITKDPSNAVVTITLYKRSSSTPSKPTTDFTYSWKRGGAVHLEPADANGWYFDLKKADSTGDSTKAGMPYYIITATVSAVDNSSSVIIKPEDWSEPALAAQSFKTYVRYSDEENPKVFSSTSLDPKKADGSFYLYRGEAIWIADEEPPLTNEAWKWSKYIGDGVTYELSLSNNYVIVNSAGDIASTQLVCTGYSITGSAAPVQLKNLKFEIFKDAKQVNLTGASSTAKITAASGSITINFTNATTKVNFKDAESLTVKMYNNNDAFLRSMEIPYVVDPSATIQFISKTQNLEAQLKIDSETGISSVVKSLQNIGGAQLLSGTDKTASIVYYYDQHTPCTTVGEEVQGEDYPDKWLRVSDNNATFFRVGVYYTKFIIGETYTFSAEVKCFGDKVRIGMADNTPGVTNWQSWEDGSIRRLSITFQATNTTHGLRIDTSKNGGEGYILVRKFKLERGSLATDWCDNTGDLSSRIEQTAESITTTVDKKIGGVNLLKYTGNPLASVERYDNNTTKCNTVDIKNSSNVTETWGEFWSDTSNSFRIRYVGSDLQIDQTYTFSVDLDTLKSQVQLGIVHTNATSSFASESGTVIYSDVKERISYTFIAKNKTEWITLQGNKSGGQLNNFRVKHAQLEKGTVASAWSEDSVSLSSKIEQTADSISLEVKKVIGGVQLLSNSENTAAICNSTWKNPPSKPSEEIVLSESTGGYPDRWLIVTDNNPNIDNNNNGVRFVGKNLIVGEKYTFSAEIINYGHKVWVQVRDDKSSPEGEVWNDSIKRLAVTFTADATSKNLYAVCKWTSTSDCKFQIRKCKLEKGEKATDWSTSEGELYNSSIKIDTTGIAMSGGTIEMNAGTKLNLNSGNELNVKSGSVTIDTGSSFKVKSGGTVQITANSSADSFIDLGNDNFRASKAGGLNAVDGHFSSTLQVGGRDVLTQTFLPYPVKYGPSQPSGHNFIWIKPREATATTEKIYEPEKPPFGSRPDTVEASKGKNNFSANYHWNTPITGKHAVQLSIPPSDSTSGLITQSGNINYKIQIPIYMSAGKAYTGFCVKAVLANGTTTLTTGWSKVNINSAGTQETTGILPVGSARQFLITVDNSTVNLCSNNNSLTATVYIGLNNADYNFYGDNSHIYFNKDSKMIVTATQPSTASASVLDCDIKFVR